MKEKVSVPFMLLGILFNVCLIAANLLETKVIQIGSLTVTAGLLVFPISYIINDRNSYQPKGNNKEIHSEAAPNDKARFLESPNLGDTVIYNIRNRKNQ